MVEKGINDWTKHLAITVRESTVADQIASLRRIAGERVAARIRHEHDPLVARIVDGWPQRIEARRARELGFKAENSFDEIVRIHIDEDRGGTFVD